MSGLLAILERELRAYFFSPLAYVILTFFLLVNGYIFVLIVSFRSAPLIDRVSAGRICRSLGLNFGCQ